jgi:glucose-1-phosphate adenylyltransferase
MSSPIGTAVVGIILAGGEGKRLFPLTRDRAKPAVPFGGRYRIVDVVLSNFVNSGIYKLSVITQYKAWRAAGSSPRRSATTWRRCPRP